MPYDWKGKQFETGFQGDLYVDFWVMILILIEVIQTYPLQIAMLPTMTFTISYYLE